MGEPVSLNIMNSYMVSVWKQHNQYLTKDLLLYYSKKVNHAS